MIDEFVAAARQEGRYSETTVTITTGWLELLYRSFEPRPLLSLKSKDLTAWHQGLTWKPGPSGKFYSVSTTSQAAGAVRRFYRWAVAAGLLSVDPSRELRILRGTGQRWRPTTAEARKLLASTSPDTATGIRDRAVLGLLFETEIPVSACARLDVEHLQLDTGALLASGRTRKLHSLSDGLLDDLARYCTLARPALDRGRSQALFLNIYGSRFEAPAIRIRLRSYRQQIPAPPSFSS